MLTISFEKTTTWERVSSNLQQFAVNNWKDGCFNDVTVKAENETIEANRMVLASGSLYFEKLFKTDMKEKYQPIVELQDVDGISVKNLIEFIYTGIFVTNNENVLDLLSTADYLQINEAKQFCFNFLQSIITADTCFTILTTAQLYQNDQLKENALLCIKENIGDIEFSCKLSKKDFIVCISKMKDNQVKESTIYETIVSWVKFDEEIRSEEFLKLLFLINFLNLTVDFIKKVMLTEKLVTESFTCFKFVTEKFVIASELSQKKQRRSTKVTSFGGNGTPSRVVEVYSCFDEPIKEHADIKLAPSYMCTFAGKLADNIYVCAHETEFGEPVEEGHIFKRNIHDSSTSWIHVAVCGCARFHTTINENIWVDVYFQSRIKFYLPHLNAWIDGPKFREQRSRCTLISVKGRLYALGGSSIDHRTLSSAEELATYTLVNKGTWRYIQPMQKPRKNFAAANCGDLIYAIGGDTGSKKTKSVEKYDPTTKEWTYVSNMQFERDKHAACVVDGKIIVVGGLDSGGIPIHQIECYDPSRDAWTVVGNTEEKLYNHSLVVT